MRHLQYEPAQETGSPRSDRLASERPATGQPAVRSLADRFPHLASLNLHAGDWAALAQHGFVSAERRGERYYFKLRFRRQAAQIVRYLGSAARANAVRAELDVLQAEKRTQRELRALGHELRHRLHAAKATLQPLLASQGFRFHGLAIRRSRTKVQVDQDPLTSTQEKPRHETARIQTRAIGRGIERSAPRGTASAKPPLPSRVTRGTRPRLSARGQRQTRPPGGDLGRAQRRPDRDYRRCRAVHSLAVGRGSDQSRDARTATIGVRYVLPRSAPNRSLQPIRTAASRITAARGRQPPGSIARLFTVCWAGKAKKGHVDTHVIVARRTKPGSKAAARASPQIRIDRTLLEVFIHDTSAQQRDADKRPPPARHAVEPGHSRHSLGKRSRDYSTCSFKFRKRTCIGSPEWICSANTPRRLPLGSNRSTHFLPLIQV